MPLLSGGATPPPLTEKNLPDQSDKVFIITGGNKGIGAELAEILFSRNARVYIAARWESTTTTLMSAIRSRHPSSTGQLRHLRLDLGDLSTIKSTAVEFLRQETRLDVLWNNAGVMIPPKGSQTAQNYELQLGTNCLGPFLLTKFLTPLLMETAKKAPTSSVRVVWLSSSAAQLYSPPGGVDLENLDYKTDRKAWYKYGLSKAGNILYSTEFATRFEDSGVLSLSLDPGNLKTDLFKGVGKVKRTMFSAVVLHKPIFGAYTELYAGLSENIGRSGNGAFVQPWGKIGKLRNDIHSSTLSITEGGTGVAAKFWDWSEIQVAEYL